ncbi:MAG: UTRA domain-containing protein, partial [Sedimentibacter sp.]
DSLYHILENEYDTKIVRAKRSIEAVSAHDEICEYLELDEHIPVILFSCTTYGMVQGREVPIEYFECYYRTDHYKFYIDQVN